MGLRPFDDALNRPGIPLLSLTWFLPVLIQTFGYCVIREPTSSVSLLAAKFPNPLQDFLLTIALSKRLPPDTRSLRESSCVLLELDYGSVDFGEGCSVSGRCDLLPSIDLRREVAVCDRFQNLDRPLAKRQHKKRGFQFSELECVETVNNQGLSVRVACVAYGLRQARSTRQSTA